MHNRIRDYLYFNKATETRIVEFKDDELADVETLLRTSTPHSSTNDVNRGLSIFKNSTDQTRRGSRNVKALIKATMSGEIPPFRN